ncbi:GAF domain-containing SpoIIE family protein phosphatase [Streptomyces sp. CA-249302]|uniref:GAF domain-containing SpoIIE family protein phosphatase n=1 Tax=Streptomyces sp. CA-249302 TaxID=3240058 RepID=UPI003D945406
MSTEIEASPTPGGPERPQSPRDVALASALLELKDRLAATTYAAYLPVHGRPALRGAVAVDTPCGFTVPSELSLEDMRQPTARAYRTGELIVAEADEVRELIRQVPELFLHSPFPMAVASVPLVEAGRTFGCLSVRWSRTQTRGTPVAPDDLRLLQTVAEKLAGQLHHLAEAGLSMEAPTVPIFIAPAPMPLPDAGSTPAADQLGRGVTGTTFLYQLRRLSTQLAGAVQIRDVLTAAQDQVMAPFGASALMLCLVQEGRLRVVGSSGFSRDEVGHVEGTPLSRSTPETDTVTLVEARLHQSGDASARTSEPRANDNQGNQPRAYMPLIANGRSIGCCILEFPAPWHCSPADEEIALTALMLGQIGQALERVYAQEVEHAFARTMQESLLPPSLPLTPETVVTSRYLPATEGAAVGGDWYDAIPLPDDRIGLVIGDVEGHSPQAAGVMGHLRSAVLAYATEGHEPATILERTDRLLRILGTSRFATCCCLWLDPATGVAKVATAGHPLPLVSPAPGELTALDVPVGPPLGLGDDHHYEQQEITLGPGTITALFTDGLLDTRALGPDDALTRLGTVFSCDQVRRYLPIR